MRRMPLDALFLFGGVLLLCDGAPICESCHAFAQNT
jgi:hypothetical protein